MEISARNQFKGTVKSVVTGCVMAGGVEHIQQSGARETGVGCPLTRQERDLDCLSR